MWFNKKEKFSNDDARILDELFHTSNAIPFEENTRIRAKAKLFQRISETKQLPREAFGRPNSFIVRFSTRSVFASVLVLTVLVSSTGIVRANDAVPGDVLYPIDKLIEELHLAATADPEKKLKITIAIAAERLQELEDISETIANETPMNEVLSDTAASSPKEVTVNNDIEHVITVALSEVDTAIEKVFQRTENLSLKKSENEESIQERKEIFFRQAAALTEREMWLETRIKERSKRKEELRSERKESDEHDEGDDLGEDDSDERNIIEEIISKKSLKNIAEEGNDGNDGEDGRDGSDGEDGRDGSDSEDGRDGSDSEDGSESKGSNETRIKTKTRNGDEEGRHDLNDNERNDDNDDSNDDKDVSIEVKIENGKEKLEIDNEEVELEGVIEFAEGNQLIVFGREVIIMEETRIDLRKNATIAVGRWADIKGFLDAGIIMATKIKVK